MAIARNRRTYASNTNEFELFGLIACGTAIGVGLAILAGMFLAVITSDDPYTRCTLTMSHDTCAYSLK